MGDEGGPGPEIGYTGARFGGPSRRKARRRKSAGTGDGTASRIGAGSAGEDHEALTEVFGAVPAGSGNGSADDPDSDNPGPYVGPGDAGPDANGPVGDEPGGEGRTVGYTGARFGGGGRRRRKASRPGPAEEAPSAPVAGPAPPAPTPPLPGPAREGTYVDPTGALSVRPYVYTGGRTRPRFEMSIEALVSAVPTAPVAHLSGEHQGVVALCGEVRSVAEIAALLNVPLGVARVLVGDLAAAGAVTLHRTADATGPDLALMERVLSGLRRL